MTNQTLLVADAGPLIALARIELLSILQTLFEKVLVPPTVVKECTFDLHKPGAQAIQHALEKGVLIHYSSTSTVKKELIAILDAGEAEALTLAKQLSCVVLMDERKGRQVAQQLDVVVIGSASILATAKNKGIIKTVKPYIQRLQQFGYHYSDNLIKTILTACNE